MAKFLIFIPKAFGTAGQKLNKTVFYRDSIKIVDYLDGFQYAGNILQFFPHPEGYVKVTPTYSRPGDMGYAYNYVFNYTDHLGNVRVSYSKDPRTNRLKILEENHYYPFGLRHEIHYPSSRNRDFRAAEGLNGGQVGEPVELVNVTKTEYQYKYNGKEWQDELGLGLYDLGFRNYMPDIGRFTTIDPMADFVNYQSPYVMADNNPVIYVDVYGLGIINAIGNLLKRAFNGIAGAIIPRSMQSCSCNYETKESLGDAFRRPDFPGRGSRGSNSGSPNSSSPSSSTPTNGNNKVVSTMDIPEIGLAMNDFSPEISGNINIPDLSSLVPNRTVNSNSGNIFTGDKPRNIDASIDFNQNSTSISKTELNDKALNDLVKVMRADPKLGVLIMGNTTYKRLGYDANTIVTVDGKDKTVGDLQIGRARSIEAFLIRHGIDPKRIKVGYGNKDSLSTSFIFK